MPFLKEGEIRRWKKCSEHLKELDSRYIGFDETCVFFNVTMTTASMTERRRRPIVFEGAFEGKTLVIVQLILAIIIVRGDNRNADQDEVKTNPGTRKTHNDKQ
jgi:hypothetical protein